MQEEKRQRRRFPLIQISLALILVGVVVVIILGLLGPATGNIFSNVVSALGGGGYYDGDSYAAESRDYDYSPTSPSAGQETAHLNAGEIDDNAEWDGYMEYRQHFLSQYSSRVVNIDVTERERIHVTDSAGFPVLGALVQIYVNNQIVAEMRTYATGETLFFPNAHVDTHNERSFFVTVTKGDARAEFTLDRGQKPVHEVVLGEL